jgi:hypothetical protein
MGGILFIMLLWIVVYPTNNNKNIRKNEPVPIAFCFEKIRYYVENLSTNKSNLDDFIGDIVYVLNTTLDDCTLSWKPTYVNLVGEKVQYMEKCTFTRLFALYTDCLLGMSDIPEDILQHIIACPVNSSPSVINKNLVNRLKNNISDVYTLHKNTINNTK